MNFVTPEFAVFFFVVLALVRLCSTGGPAAFGPELLVANLVFYATAGIIFVPLLLTVAALNWGAARLLCTAHSQISAASGSFFPWQAT